jgi:hypothetical protein
LLSPTDQIRLRNRHHQEGRGIRAPLLEVPDNELVACLVALGQPPADAGQLRDNPQLRLAALRLWVDVGDAGKGDKQARERVDYVRECFARLRKEGLISDDPARGDHHIVDPADLL